MQILVDHDELPVILIGLLGQVPFAAGRMSAELQEQQRIGIMYTPQICDVPVALLQCILTAVLVRGRCQQDLDYFSTLFVPVVARLFKSAVHETLLYVNCLADKEDVPQRDAPNVPKDLTVLLDVIGETSLQLTTLVGSQKHLSQVPCCASSCVSCHSH